MHVVAPGGGETIAHSKLSRFERLCEGERSTKACEGISGQNSREENEANEVESGGRKDGCANNDFG